MPEVSADNPRSTPKLNILALPSHTSILFALITLVVLGAALASLLPNSGLWWPPIVLGMTLLPLRAFLHRPDWHMKRLGLTHHDDEATVIIEKELASFGVGGLPTVVIADQPLGAHAFGAFCRRYIGLGRSLAQEIAEGLGAEAGRRSDHLRAILAHELAHFLNRDVWLMWLSHALMMMMILVMGLNLWVGFNLSLFIIENGPEVAQPEFFARLFQHATQMLPGMPSPDLHWIYDTFYQQNPTVMEQLTNPALGLEHWELHFFRLVSSHLPFVVSGLVLFVIYWRRLLQVRELYADARAAALMGDAAIVRQATAVHSVLLLNRDLPSRWERLRGRISRLPERMPVLGLQLALHPSLRERRDCLAEPLRALGSWRWIAVSVGLAVVLLDFLLRGTLTAGYIKEPGAYLPLLAGFLVFAIWLLPWVCMGNDRRNLIRRVAGIVLLFTLIKLIPRVIDASLAIVMLFINPEVLGKAIDLWAYSLTGGFATELPRLMGVEVSWAEFLNYHLVWPLAYFTFLMPPTLMGFLLTDAALKQRALTWYRLGERVRRVFWAVSGVLALVLALVVLPLYDPLFCPNAHGGWSVAALVGVAAAFVAVLVGGILFWRYDQKLAARCPGCGTRVPGRYRLGKRCERCGEALHSWLVANY